LAQVRQLIATQCLSSCGSVGQGSNPPLRQEQIAVQLCRPQCAAATCWEDARGGVFKEIRKTPTCNNRTWRQEMILDTIASPRQGQIAIYLCCPRCAAAICWVGASVGCGSQTCKHRTRRQGKQTMQWTRGVSHCIGSYIAKASVWCRCIQTMLVKGQIGFTCANHVNAFFYLWTW
jgi:hypothetical protein